MSEWNSCGLDALSLTFREGEGAAPIDLIDAVSGLYQGLGFAGVVKPRERGFHGYTHGASLDGGTQVDWTPLGGDGPNRGYASLQIKGEVLDHQGAEEVALLIRTLRDLRPYRASRVDTQITSTVCPSATELIREFRAGRLRVVRKESFEAKGAELAGGKYPKGATITHGSRESENYVRQYDKHLESGEGPPRLRTEIEAKGNFAAKVWTLFSDAVAQEVDAGERVFTAEARLTRQLIRQYMPLRDTSRWAGQELPKDWASEAQEPDWWAALFDEEALRLRRERGPSKPFRRAIGYMHTNYGGRYLQDLVWTRLELEDAGMREDMVRMQALVAVRDRFVINAKDAKLQELLENLPVDKHARARELWFEEIRESASNEEDERDLNLSS